MSRKPTILFAEDSENDAMLIRRGFERANVPYDLHFVSDGAEACDYLSGRGGYADRAKFPLPSVLLTDLKMPKMDGFDLLAWVRSQEPWRELPVIIVTGSDQVEDRKRATQLGASFYVLKEMLMRPPWSLLEEIGHLVAPERYDQS